MNIIGPVAAIATAFIGLAIIAVLVSRQAQTPQVIQAASTGFGSIISAAVAPVAGGSSGVFNQNNLFGSNGGFPSYGIGGVG